MKTVEKNCYVRISRQKLVAIFVWNNFFVWYSASALDFFAIICAFWVCIFHHFYKLCVLRFQLKNAPWKQTQNDIENKVYKDLRPFYIQIEDTWKDITTSFPFWFVENETEDLLIWATLLQSLLIKWICGLHISSIQNELYIHSSVWM